MDERLPLGSLDATTLRMLLEKERSRQTELEQEVARLQAGLARQNERIIQLEQEHGQLHRENRELRELLTGVTEQNTLLRQQAAALQTENERLRGGRPEPHQPSPWPSERTKQDTPPKTRKKRDQSHNRGRRRMSQVDERVAHAAETCPRCGTPLAGGWVHRQIQVIELPAPRQALVTEHVLIRRQCSSCRCRVLAPTPGMAAGRLGSLRFGPRLLALIATMATVERLPIRQIRARLAREYDLPLSTGGVSGLLAQVAQRGMGQYEAIRTHIRGSPVVGMDETGWREDGLPGYIWTMTTPDACLFHRDPHRTGSVADDLLGQDFAGTLVTDFYAAYDHLEGAKQRCWAHLWRDIADLEREYPDDAELGTWVAGVRAIYDAATGVRPKAEQGTTPEAERARGRRATRYEQQLLRLCPDTLGAARPEATLAKRVRRYLTELFTFVRDPAVPPTNNQSERSLRHLVIARKVSGGTRSAAGSETRMVLASLASTAARQGVDPMQAFLHVLTADPGSPPSHTF